MTRLARVIPLPRHRRGPATPPPAPAPQPPTDDLTALAAAAGVLNDRRPPCPTR